MLENYRYGQLELWQNIYVNTWLIYPKPVILIAMCVYFKPISTVSLLRVYLMVCFEGKYCQS